MTKEVDRRFLTEVQAAGWSIEAVETGRVIARCPRYRCNVRQYIAPGQTIVPTCKQGKDLSEVPVNTYGEARAFLRDRRDALGMNIAELEECIGLTKDHLAKIEPDNAARIPNIETFMDWAQGLGYEVVLRNVGLPAKTLATIAQTRELSVVRKRRRASRLKAVQP